VKKKKPIVEATPSRNEKTRPPFSWWSASIPDAVRATFAEKFLTMHRKELHDRACLLRRLGHSQDEVRSRLEGYELWEYEPFAASPLRAEVDKIIAEVFAPKSPRTTTLSPGT
jgi:hypothetical protein